MRARGRASSLALALALVGRPAHAGEPVPTEPLGREPAAGALTVQVIVDPCLALEPEPLEVQLEVELGPSVGVTVSSAAEAEPSPATTAVWVGCRGEATSLDLRDPVTAKATQRELSLAVGDGSSRRRALALAIVELIRASWLELELLGAGELGPIERRVPDRREPEPERSAAQPSARVESVERVPALVPAGQVRAARRVALRRPQPWRVSAGPRVHSFAGLRSAHAGGQLRLLHWPRRALGWTLAGSVVDAREPVAVGVVATTLTQLSPALVIGVERPGWAAALGLGPTLGAAWVRGDPDPDAGLSGRRYVRPLAGASGFGRLELRATPGLRVATELELGVVTSPVRVRAAGAPIYALVGPWVAAGLELGFAFGATRSARTRRTRSRSRRSLGRTRRRSRSRTHRPRTRW